MTSFGRAFTFAVRGAGAVVVVPTVVGAARARAGRVGARHEAGGNDDGLERSGAPAAGTSPSISVVIPARDEADRIAPLLRGLVDAPQVVEVIVVDDGSTDATVAVSRSFGVSVVTAGEPPSGWAGKPWALDVGLRRAVGDWVVFLDADVRVESGLASALVERAVADCADLFSAAGSFRLRPVPTWLHASMLATLVMRFGAPDARSAASPASTIVNGQCLAAPRLGLIEAGGWSPVAGQLVEDVALARAIVARGGRVVFADASDLMTVEPYADLPDVWRGWGRSIGLPGVEPRRRIVMHAVAVAVVSVLPLVRVAVRRFDLFDIGLLALRFGLAAGLCTSYSGRQPATATAVLSSPLADAMSVVAVAQSACPRRVRWRGRLVGAGRGEGVASVGRPG